MLTRIAPCSAVVAVALLAQSALKFELASVRRSDPDAKTSNVLPDRGENLRIENVSLRKIVTYAYDIRDFQLLNAPSWTADERYDISAKAENRPAESANETDDQRRSRVAHIRERLRSLLAERFQLATHLEEKEQTILALRVARSGIKFAEATDPKGSVTTYDGRIQGFGAPISMLVTQLSMATGQIVRDQSGLAGKYDFTVKWDADEKHRDDLPTLFTAVEEQLGLKLERIKGMVQTVVVDRIERPAAN